MRQKTSNNPLQSRLALDLQAARLRRVEWRAENPLRLAPDLQAARLFLRVKEEVDKLRLALDLQAASLTGNYECQ